MAKYPQQVLDSLHEYAERYKLNTKEYKDFIDNLGKLHHQSMEGVEIFNKGKTNLEKGSIIIESIPTSKGLVTRAYIVLSGVPITVDKKTEIPVLDLHSYLVQEETPIDSIKKLPTSDNPKDNKIATEGKYFVTEDFLRRRKEALEKAEDISEPRKLTRKREPKKAEKKVEKKKKETKKEDIIEIPGEGEESKKRKKIWDTAKKIKEDKIREKEEEEIRKLEETYTKMRHACVTTVHNMGYTKKEAEEICNDLEGVIEEHVHSAIEKKTPNAVEEYIRILTNKVIPSKVKKPQKLSKIKKDEKPTTKSKWQPFIENVDIDGFNLEMMKTTLYLSCLSNVIAYGMSIKDATRECNSIRGDINEIAEKIYNKSQSAEMGIDNLNDIVHKKIEISKVAKKAQQVVKQVEKSYADSLKSELLTYYGVDPKNVKGARGKVLMDLAAAIRSRRGGQGFQPIHTLPDPNDPEITVYMSRQWCYIVKHPGAESEENWRLAFEDGLHLGYYEKEAKI